MTLTRDGPHQVWSPVELSLVGAVDADPFSEVTVSATFEHESGAEYAVPGFWDGDRNWRVRFAPPREGRWTYAVESDPDADGLAASGSFEAVAYEGRNPLARHGFLRVDGEQRRFVHDDGTPYFWLADTAWAAGGKADRSEWRRYLDARQAQGFTSVMLNSLPQHDASKPQNRLPFGEEWDLDRPNPEYFAALDDLVAATHDRGLVPSLVALWFDNVPGTNDDWNAGIPRHPFDESQAARWGRYLAARYGAYGTVWLVSGDTDFPESAVSVYDALGEALTEYATHPLCTLHTHSGVTTPDALLDREWLDFHCYQSGHHAGDRQRNAYRYGEDLWERDDRPVVNGEPCYERHGYFEDQSASVSRETARRAAYWSVLGGGTAGLGYGAHGVWQWHRRGEHFEGTHVGIPDPWDDALDFPGARDYARLASVLGDPTLEPLSPDAVLRNADETVRAATDGETLYVYAPEGDPLSIRDDEVADDPRARWFDPADGREEHASVGVSDDVRVSSPSWDGDALLLCQR